MRAEATFEVADFIPATVSAEPPIATAVPVGVATMLKTYGGEVSGRSTTIFTSAFDQSAGTGTYVALESFEGSLNGRAGAFNFVHSATTGGRDRSEEFFLIVPSSGTDELAGITGRGGLSIDADGTHRLWFEYDLPTSG
jgi:Protein of unknown function (DUF3224)